MAVVALGAALVSVGGNVQADNITITSSPPDVMQNAPNVTQTMVCDNTGGVMETTGDYILIDVDCWHSGICWVCDEDEDYVCNEGIYSQCLSPCPFADPVPEGGIVTRIEAEVRGVPSYSPPSIKVYVNNTLVGEGIWTGNFVCDECWPFIVSSETYEDGFPGYVYSGQNNLSLEIDGQACFSDVHLKLYYYEPTENVGKAHPSVSPSTPNWTRNLNPPTMSVQFVNINPQQVIANQPVTISTNVVNNGDQGGNLNVALKINGQVEQTRMISVGPQASQPIKFTVTKGQPGTYAVDIGGQTGKFTIKDTSGTTDTPINSGFIIILVIGVLALAIAVVLILSFSRSA